MDKPHIVVDCRMYNASGIGTYLQNVLRGVVGCNLFKVTCLVSSSEESIPAFDGVECIEMKRKVLHPLEQLEFVEKIPACDIYWAPHFNAPMPKPRKAKRMITTIHDVYHLANAQKFKSWIVRYIKLLMGSAIRRSTDVITVSNFSQSEIIRFFPGAKDKLTVCHLGVLNDFEAQAGSTPAGVGDYILYVGNVKPHKNISLVMRAMELMENKEFKFVVVGRQDGFYTNDESLKRLDKGILERVIFTGYVPNQELISYYSNAKAFVFPSLYEGFGLPVLEAMKFKIPILASSAASIPEVGGEAVRYFDPESPEVLAGLLTGVLNGQIRFDYALYEERVNAFNWEATVEKHIKIFLGQK